MLMKFGAFDHVDSSGEPLHIQLENRLRMTEVYDRCGLYAYQVAEHHGTPLGHAPSPGIYLSAVAQRTKHIHFGPMVYLLPLYHPIRLIEEVAMLDQMSNGRLLLGVGRGVSPIEQAFYGVNLGETASVYKESLEILLQGLQNDSLSYKGTHFQFDNVPMTVRPYQQPHPPLWYGALHPDSLVWAAENDVNVVTLGLTPQVKAIVDRYKQEWSRLGKPEAKMPCVGVTRHMVIAPTDQEARAIAKRGYKMWHDSFAKLWYDNDLPVPFVESIYPEDWDQLQEIGNGFAGTPEKARKYVMDEVEATGINYMSCWFVFGDINVADATRSVEAFSEHVMSAFASSSAASPAAARK
jgi:alkanesulfonate monooxygenase SsuD/methylene tetrahydromethanopterin reductase-like flavin-dependent oxidoreductase (luciferase family)